MKFLKLKLRNGKIITEYKRGVYSDDFFYPFNYYHIYNMMCCLLDKTPTPQNRKVDNKYMPFYDDVMDCVKKGFVKINCVSEKENITTIKTAYNANATNESIKQYTWFDCELTMKDSFSTFKDILKNDFNISYSVAYIKGFADTMSQIVNCGNNIKIDNLKIWLKNNNNTIFVNYIENHKDYKGSFFKNKIKFDGRDLNKRVFRGCVTSNTYEAIMYIPLTDKLKDEYDNYSLGWSSMLDGGLVEFQDYGVISEIDILGFTKIKELTNQRKSILFKKDIIDFKNNIYENMKKNISKDNVIDLLKSLKLENDYEEIDLDTLFSKKVSMANVNSFMNKIVNKKYQKENILDIDYVKDILTKMFFTWKDEYIDSDFTEITKSGKPKLNISQYRIVRLINKLISNKLNN